ncbi:Eco57I restriction-modification methylase domain-containing protein [Nocardia carnea]|uniref:site-specific DNA-methyltransferase (adenine-specific) n=1 Tax=Nocardia carnea TaxID=37328 RepID=A0ABW7TMF4_9NOCA|nr:methyltransferase domain-containing protein [Nocardia carnea]
MTWFAACVDKNARMGRDGAGARERKRHGRHYTPTALAEFLAGRVAARVVAPGSGLRVLDPACGGGELLFAIRAALAERLPEAPVELVGYDVDPEGLTVARERAARAGVVVDWRQADFLAEYAALPAQSFHVVIANPPYVRTQQLGGEAAQALRGQFGLHGRFDLTHPFVAAVPRLLVPDGVFGLLCANRFLTTKAGANLRAVLLGELAPVELYDLGDTRLFEAAVLPAVTIAVRGRGDERCRYVSVYQESPADRAAHANVERRVEDAGATPVPAPTSPADIAGRASAPRRPGGALPGGAIGDPARGVGAEWPLPATPAPDESVPYLPGGHTECEGRESSADVGRDHGGPAGDCGPFVAEADLFDVLGAGTDATIRWQGRRFAVTVGELAIPAGSAAVGWRMARVGHDDWLDAISARMWRTFGDLARIRVGIKTNADRVFIAEHWGEPDTEPELLCDLITHHDLRPWRVEGSRRARVLYPYDLDHPRRIPVDLARYPRTAAYLEQHREVLSARSYLTDAGRKWFEHWVPQRPHMWRTPKVVFPDISDRPRFALDRSGAVVNGDCYWISLSELDGDFPAEELACLMMGIANSALGVRFYDAVCGNRLYSGRRRWITQYVSRLPLPDPAGAPAVAIADLVRALVQEPERALVAQQELDDLVNRAFAL